MNGHQVGLLWSLSELVESCPWRLFVCPLAVNSNNITTRHLLFFCFCFSFCSVSGKRIRTRTRETLSRSLTTSLLQLVKILVLFSVEISILVLILILLRLSNVSVSSSCIASIRKETRSRCVFCHCCVTWILNKLSSAAQVEAHSREFADQDKQRFQAESRTAAKTGKAKLTEPG